MGETMQAAVLWAPHDIRVDEVSIPNEIRPDEVLIKVERTAICGTDLHPYEGHMEIEEGVILGHEFLGEVVAAGDSVRSVNVGARATAACATSCGNCYHCRKHEPGSCVGKRMFGMGIALGDLQGAQTEYVVVPDADRNIRTIPADAPEDLLDDLLFVGDIITTGYEAVARRFRPGDSVAVVGAGPVGLCAVMSALALGASRVIAIDPVESRRALASRLGAVAMSPQEAGDGVLDLTDWRGADVVVDAAGHPDALASTVGYVRAGGVVAIPSVYLQDSVPLPWGDFWLKNVNFHMGVTHFCNTMDEVMALVLAGKLNPSRLISHRMGLSEATEAYRLFASREAQKIVLDPTR